VHGKHSIDITVRWIKKTYITHTLRQHSLSLPQVVLAAKVRVYREGEAIHVGLVLAITIDLLTRLVIGANYTPTSIW
jgi:hypothetical protein